MSPKKSQKRAENPIPEHLFAILACPLCKNDLIYSNDKKWLVCKSCDKKYEIKEGIPILLPPSR